MASNDPIGILGGTFDPIHNGHLRSALEVLENLRLAEVRFMPCHYPPHRNQPAASAAHRLSMLRSAVAGQPGFFVDDRELRRDGPSYMVESLESLRLQFGSRSFCLLLGTDAFNGLLGWHRWQELLGLTHIVVLHRPGFNPNTAAVLDKLNGHCQLDNPAELRDQPSGSIFFQPVTPLDISATCIRTLLGAGRSPRYLLPESVQAYIRDYGLYRSSTAIS